MKKRLDPKDLPTGDLMTELKIKTEHLTTWVGDIPITKSKENVGEESVLTQLKKLNKTTATNTQGSQEGQHVVFGIGLKPVNAIDPEKEKTLRAGYILEKLDAVTKKITKTGYNLALGLLKEEELDLENCIPRLKDEKEKKEKEEKLEGIKNKIEEIYIEQELAQAYLTQEYLSKFDLNGALNHPFMTYSKYKEEAEKYADAKIDEIRKRLIQ